MRVRVDDFREALIKYVPRHAGEYQHPVSYCFYWFLACARMTTCCILRLNQSFLSYIRAIAEMNTGELYMSKSFVRATGACSAPPPKIIGDSMANMGRMKNQKCR